MAALAAAAAVGAVVWVRAKLRVRKITAADAPVKGNPEEGIVLYGTPLSIREYPSGAFM